MIIIVRQGRRGQSNESRERYAHPALRTPALHSYEFQVCPETVRGRESREVEPGLEYIKLAIRAENSKRDQRIASVSSSKPRECLEVRGRKIFIFPASAYFREMLVSFR